MSLIAKPVALVFIFFVEYGEGIYMTKLNTAAESVLKWLCNVVR